MATIHVVRTRGEGYGVNMKNVQRDYVASTNPTPEMSV